MLGAVAQYMRLTRAARVYGRCAQLGQEEKDKTLGDLLNLSKKVLRTPISIHPQNCPVLPAESQTRRIPPPFASTVSQERRAAGCVGKHALAVC